MKFAICNETFGDQPFEQAWALAREIGYRGIEIAPFTLVPGKDLCDVRDISAEQRTEIRQQAANAGLEVVGLHWLLARTEAYYLTSPDKMVREATAEYLKQLAQLCSDLGGQIMVLGSPYQRNLLPNVTYGEAEQYAAEVLSAVMSVCADLDVVIALEPLGPSEGDFLLTAQSAIKLAKMVDSPQCKLHLDVKAMSSESTPVADIIRASRDWTVHFHANDPNLLGPGMGEEPYEPILEALRKTRYDGWVSVEVFKYEPSPEVIARQSLEYMQQVLKEIE